MKKAIAQKVLQRQKKKIKMRQKKKIKMTK